MRFVVAPAVFVLVTAWIATRNARKTPHERLKNLVDIAKNMPAGVDRNDVVIGAIARELVDFDRRLKADQSTFRARWKERFVQNGGAIYGWSISVGLFLFVIAFSFAVTDRLAGTVFSLVGSLVSILVALASSVSSVLRKSRRARIQQQRVAVADARRVVNEQRSFELNAERSEEIRQVRRKLIEQGASTEEIDRETSRMVLRWLQEDRAMRARWAQPLDDYRKPDPPDDEPSPR